MKQNNVLLLIIVATVSLVISIFASKLIFSNPVGSLEQVDVVPSISAAFPKPSNKYFNSQSIDPAQYITIGNNNNNSPFNTPTQ